eukprot:2140954-Rhodomonas_salina.1
MRTVWQRSEHLQYWHSSHWHSPRCFRVSFSLSPTFLSLSSPRSSPPPLLLSPSSSPPLLFLSSSSPPPSGRCMNVVERLAFKHAAKMSYYLTKFDTAGDEVPYLPPWVPTKVLSSTLGGGVDRTNVVSQIVQELQVGQPCAYALRVFAVLVLMPSRRLMRVLVLMPTRSSVAAL